MLVAPPLAGVPILIYGVPYTLLTRIKLPTANGIDAVVRGLVSLGFGTSIIVEPTWSTSNPLTYAVPADTLMPMFFSSGTLPSSVTSSSVKRPPLPVSSLRRSTTSTTKLSTA